ncbi:hypothetical protein [Chthonobacter albigriseus]|uniref:hypothetical protein n=1 Tax=Chthonobacter albigriseus TaxID=1683161 RepID=UPI0015EED5A5|nr:hypothetical protein [Chthonobacter albigriseus]
MCMIVGVYLTFNVPKAVLLGRTAVLAALIGYPVVLTGFFIYARTPIPTSFVEISLSFLPALLFLDDRNGSERLKQLAGFLVVYAAINVLADIIQTGLYGTIGRLPALAYEGYAARFGGVWDDPNTALAVFSFVLPYVVLTRGLGRHAVLTFVAAVYVGYSAQSLTAGAATLGAMIVSFTVYNLVFASEAAAARALTTVAVGGLAGLMLTIALAVLFQDFVAEQLVSLNQWYEDKLPSIEARASTYDVVSFVDIGTLIGLNPIGISGENGLLNLVANMGVPYALLYEAMGLATLIRLIRRAKLAKSPHERALFFSCFSFGVYFYSSMLNIPVSEIYPVNFIMGVVIGIAWSPIKAAAAKPRLSRRYGVAANARRARDAAYEVAYLGEVSKQIARTRGR